MSSTFGFAYPLDPGFAALLGALIGSGSSVVVQIIAAIIIARNNTKSFRREQRKEEIMGASHLCKYSFHKLAGSKVSRLHEQYFYESEMLPKS